MKRRLGLLEPGVKAAAEKEIDRILNGAR